MSGSPHVKRLDVLEKWEGKKLVLQKYESTTHEITKKGLKPIKGEEKAEEKMPEDLDIELATMDLEPKRKSINEIMTGKEEPVDEIQKEEPKGLMARRVQDGV